MTTVLVFARLTDPAVADVRAVLRDWAAAGLVDPPIWIDVDQPADPRRPVAGWESSPIGEQVVSVNAWFAAQHVAAGGQGVRLVCLQVLSDPAQVVGFGAVAQLRERLALPGLQLINVLAVAEGLTGLSDQAVFDSQRNVVLQPVDTEEPAGQTFTVAGGSAAALHAACGLATVAGLWSAVGEAPNDRDHPWPGGRVQVARSYLRFLDGTEVLDGIAEAVLDENDGRPTSRTPQGQMFTLVSPDARVSTAESAADQLVAAQAVALYHPLPPPPRPARKQVKAGAALADFFSFLGGALVKAPGQWVTRKVESVQTGVASRLTSALYGEEGAYEVVLGNRPGSVPDAQSAADGARWLLTKLAPAGSEPPSPDAHALWRGEVSLSVALLDGSPTTVAEMPTRGTQRLLVGDPAAVAPAPDAPAFSVPPGLLRSQAPVRITPDDPYTARRVLTELGELQQQSSTQGWNEQGWGGGGWSAGPSFGPGGPGRNQGAQAGLVAGQLRQWMEQRRSFTFQVSDRIAQGLLSAQADQLALLNASTGEEIAAARAGAQQEAGHTRTRLLGWFAGLVIGILAIVLLVLLVKLAPWLVATIVLLVLVIWLIGALTTFVKSSQRYYQLIQALDTLAARRAWADEHALSVPQAITRLADVYRRSRQWSAVIGELVHDPFCRDARVSESAGRAVRLTGTLPYGMALGHLPFDPESYRNEVFRAAAITLQPGWLDTAEAARRALALSVRSRQSGVREQETVFNSDGTDHSALAALVAAQREPEFRQANAAGAVAWLTGKLQSGGFDLKHAVLDAGGSPRPVHASEYVQQLVEAVPVPSQEGISAGGVQRGAADVATTHLWGVPGQTTQVSEPSSQPGGVSVRRIVLHPSAPLTGRRLLDRLVVRCDMTRSLEPGELSYFASSAVGGDESGPAGPAGSTVDEDAPPPTFRTRA